MPQLPEEITEEILIRLQVVDLLRFKSVCTQWYRIIRSANFIRRHLEHSKANRSHHRILTPYSQSSMKTIDCGDLFGGEVVATDLPPPCDTAVTFLGSCDGLVCYFSALNNRIFVWNPATRMRKSLKTLRERNEEGIVFHWFGHESDDDSDYKLVIGTSADYKNFIHLIDPFADDDEDGWKSTREIGKPYAQIGAGTLFNGRVHWAANHGSIDQFGDFVIVSFDLRSQTIVEIPGHEGTIVLEFAGRGGTIMLEIATMCVMNGCLSAIHRTWEGESSKPSFEVWMMKEYGVKESWTKLATILSDIDVRPCPMSAYPFLCVLKVTNEGDLIVKVEETEVMVCNIGEGKSRNLMSNEGRVVMYVVESLVFPSGVPIVGWLAKIKKVQV